MGDTTPWAGTSDLVYLQQRSFATQKWHLSNYCLMQVMHSPVLLFPSPKWAWYRTTRSDLPIAFACDLLLRW